MDFSNRASDLKEMKNPGLQRRTCTIKELAQLLGVSLPNAYNLSHIEGFPVIVIGNRRIVLLEKLDQWLEEHVGMQLVPSRGGYSDG